MPKAERRKGTSLRRRARIPEYWVKRSPPEKKQKKRDSSKVGVHSHITAVFFQDPSSICFISHPIWHTFIYALILYTVDLYKMSNSWLDSNKAYLHRLVIDLDQEMKSASRQREIEVSTTDHLTSIKASESWKHLYKAAEIGSYIVELLTKKPNPPLVETPVRSAVLHRSLDNQYRSRPKGIGIWRHAWSADSSTLGLHHSMRADIEMFTLTSEA